MLLQIGVYEGSLGITLGEVYKQTAGYFEKTLNISTEFTEIPAEDVSTYDGTQGPISQEADILFIPIERGNYRWLIWYDLSSVTEESHSIVTSGTPDVYTCDGFFLDVDKEVHVAFCLTILLVALVITLAEKRINRHLGIASYFKMVGRLAYSVGQSIEKIPTTKISRGILCLWFLFNLFFSFQINSVLKTENSVTVYKTMDTLDDILPNLKPNEQLKTLKNSYEEIHLETESPSSQTMNKLLLKIREYEDNTLSAFDAFEEDLYSSINDRKCVFITSTTLLNVMTAEAFPSFGKKLNLYFSKKPILSKVLHNLLSHNLSSSLVSAINFRFMIIFENQPFGYLATSSSYYTQKHRWIPENLAKEAITIQDFKAYVLALCATNLMALFICCALIYFELRRVKRHRLFNKIIMPRMGQC